MSELLSIIDSLLEYKYEQEHIMKDNEKRKFEYVIGIDLGHGETSAALCPLQWEVLPSQLDPAKDLELGGNKKVMPSAITILDNGTAYIGDAAFNPEILRQAEVHVCFKKAPKDINGEAEQLMMRFMKEVYRRIRENNSGLLTDTNHLVYIATPSGWDKPTQDLYLQMAHEAGLPIAGLTKESRAAFVRAQHDATSGIGRNIDKGAIVFDMGSSTLDFTYMNKNLPGLIDFGYDCGASAVEKTIYAEKREEEDCIQEFEKKFPGLVDFLVFEARKVKEQIYIDPTLRVKRTINFEDIVDDEDLEDERFRLVFQPGDLNELLTEKGYIQQIANAMADYRENHIKGQNIYGVFMTGGASRMDFLKPLICKYFGVEESQVYRDQDPSLTISQGVAEVARMDMRTEGMDEGLGSQIDKLINGNKIFDTFAEKFGAEAFELATNIIATNVTMYKDIENDVSIDALNSSIESDMKEHMGELTSNVSEYVKNAILDCTSDIRKRVDDIVAVYTSQGNDIKLPTLSVPKITMGSISIKPVLDKIAKELAEQASTWSTGGAVAGAATGAAIGSVVPFFGTITGAIIGGAIGAFSGDKPTLSEEKAKDRDRGERLKIYNVVDSEWEDIKKNVQNTINKNVKGNNKIREVVKKVTSDYLTAYKDSLQSSRILID